MADDEGSGSQASAVALLSEALSLLDDGSQYVAAAFVAQAIDILKSNQPAP